MTNTKPGTMPKKAAKVIKLAQLAYDFQVCPVCKNQIVVFADETEVTCEGCGAHYEVNHE